MRLSIFILLVFFASCFSKGEKQSQSENRKQTELKEQLSNQNAVLDTCRTYTDLESHQNQDAYIEGKIIEYVPPHDSSKLGDEKIWNWEIVLSDNYSIPLTAKNKKLDINSYIGKNVIVKAFIKYGIIFGYENTANIVGTRIDAMEIHSK